MDVDTIDIEELKTECEKVVRTGDLDTLTDRIVRRTVEKNLGLAEKALDAQPYKQTVKDTVIAILEDISKNTDDDAKEQEETEEPTKDKSDSESTDPRNKDEPEQDDASGPIEGNGSDSESELSDLIDEDPAPPKRKRSAQSSSPKSSKKAKSSRADSSTPKSAEGTITNLKSYINKCGVRKIWSKELAGMNGAQQIRHLKQLLSDLGMVGRPTLEKCKRIKSKRDLLSEMEDMDTSNIINEEDEIPSRAEGRRRRSAASGDKKSIYTMDLSDESEDEENEEDDGDEEKGNEEVEGGDGDDEVVEDSDDESSQGYTEDESESEDDESNSKDDEKDLGSDSDHKPSTKNKDKRGSVKKSNQRTIDDEDDGDSDDFANGTD